MQSPFLHFTQTGKPQDVLELTRGELPPLKPHEVRLAMRYAPVNPADLNFIEGTYGKTPTLPAVPGIEGSGEVIEVGSGVASLAKGDFVIPLHGVGTWSQHININEMHCAKLPPNIDMVQASMLRVNPVTAWRLLHDFVELRTDEWIIQNAANSGVGRSLIQLAKKLGFRTLNFVRRSEIADELKDLGADVVLVDDDTGNATAREILGSDTPRLAANAVGGDSALRLMDLLAPHGTLVTYGAMSRKSVKVPNRFLIFKDLTLRGLWVTKWLEHASHAEIYQVLHPLAEMMIDRSLQIAVDTVVPLRDFKQAITLAQTEGRKGKVVLDLMAD